MAEKKLRRYQVRALEAFEKWYDVENDSSSLEDRLATIILPTGTGKTFTAVSCIKKLFEKNKKVKVLWVAHREELITQARDELSLNIPGANVQVEMAKDKASADADIVVGSVQTMRRLRKNMEGFIPDLVVVDEWHHYHEKNVQYNGLIERYNQAKILGLTATPFRFVGGDLPLGLKLMEMDIGTAIAHNYLVAPKAEVLKSKVSLAKVKSRAGDFAVGELSEAVNTKERNWLITKRLVQAVKDEGRQGVLFGVDVNHSKDMAEMLREAGLRVAEVYGETDKEERRELMDKIRNREIDVLCNCLVATEGFDVPHLDFVCIARPTKSLGLYIQMMGRGLRLSGDKRDCLIIDIFDMVKATQGVASYKKVAAVGDIDGSRRRSQAILKEELADKLSNFPVVMKLGKGDTWQLDNINWMAPAWMLDTNQWVVTWSKRSERVKTGSVEWSPMKYTPKKTNLQSNPIEVRHKIHGEGLAHDINYGSENHYLTVDFGQNGTKNLTLSSLETKTETYENKPLDKPVKRAFYIISNDTKTYCRIIALLKEGSDFSVQTDIKGDETTVNEVIRSLANEDDMVPIIKKDAAWRKRPASTKQKNLIQNMVTWGKIGSDIDIESLSGGDASALMDQVDWKPIINNLFGAKSKEDLIGYKSEFDDV